MTVHLDSFRPTPDAQSDYSTARPWEQGPKREFSNAIHYACQRQLGTDDFIATLKLEEPAQFAIAIGHAAPENG